MEGGPHMSLGRKLYEIRMKRNETQESVAESVGISYVSLSRYENEQRMPKMDILKRLAAHYNVSVDELMEVERNPVVSTEPFNPDDMAYAEAEDANIRILARGVSRMTPENRQKLLEVARALFKDDFDDQGNKR